MNKETIVAARVSGKKLEEIKINMHDCLTEGDFDGLPVEKVDVKQLTLCMN
jgi:hypothetical protein